MCVLSSDSGHSVHWGSSKARLQCPLALTSESNTLLARTSQSHLFKLSSKLVIVSEGTSLITPTSGQQGTINRKPAVQRYDSHHVGIFMSQKLLYYYYIMLLLLFATDHYRSCIYCISQLRASVQSVEKWVPTFCLGWVLRNRYENTMK